MQFHLVGRLPFDRIGAPIGPSISLGGDKQINPLAKLLVPRTSISLHIPPHKQNNAIKSSPMDTQEGEMYDIARSILPHSNPQPAQPMLCSLSDITGPIKNEISNSQHCKATDMLHFLFSFCNTGGDEAQVEPNDKKLIAAFEKIQELANKPNTPLRINLDAM